MSIRVPLAPCAQCRRHVRVTEARCPFCNREQPVVASAAPESAPSQRLKSLAVMTFRAAAVSAAVSACGGMADPAPRDGGSAGATSTGGASSTGGGDNGSGGTSAGGGQSSAGGAYDAGPSDWDGGPVPIYRATPPG